MWRTPSSRRLLVAVEWKRRTWPAADMDKRRRPESVATLPAPLPKKCFCGSGQPVGRGVRQNPEPLALGYLAGGADRVLQEAAPARRHVATENRSQQRGAVRSARARSSMLAVGDDALKKMQQSVYFFYLPMAGLTPSGRTVFFLTTSRIND
jgi:hypothetical protein